MATNLQQLPLGPPHTFDTADAQAALDLKISTTAAQAALDLKANIASPTFTGTVGGITKAMVGLTNASDTSDANKPVSTATQTALDLKQNNVVVTGPAETTTASAAAHAKKVYLVTGTTTITLPTAAACTTEFVIVNANVSEGAVTLATTGSETIDGSLSFPSLATPLAKATVVSDGTNWWTI